MIALLDEGLRGRRARLVVRPVHPARQLCRAGRDAWRFAPSLKRHNAAYFTHIRDESNRVLEAVEEAIAVARALRRSMSRSCI